MDTFRNDRSKRPLIFLYSLLLKILLMLTSNVHQSRLSCYLICGLLLRPSVMHLIELGVYQREGKLQPFFFFRGLGDMDRTWQQGVICNQNLAEGKLYQVESSWNCSLLCNINVWISFFRKGCFLSQGSLAFKFNSVSSVNNAASHG